MEREKRGATPLSRPAGTLAPSDGERDGVRGCPIPFELIDARSSPFVGDAVEARGTDDAISGAAAEDEA